MCCSKRGMNCLAMPYDLTRGGKTCNSFSTPVWDDCQDHQILNGKTHGFVCLGWIDRNLWAVEMQGRSHAVGMCRTNPRYREVVHIFSNKLGNLPPVMVSSSTKTWTLIVFLCLLSKHRNNWEAIQRWQEHCVHELDHLLDMGLAIGSHRAIQVTAFAMRWC